MSEKEFLDLFKKKLYINRDVEMTDKLNEMEEWDSFSYVAFMAMAEDEFDKKLKYAEIKSKLTIRDLYELLI